MAPRSRTAPAAAGAKLRVAAAVCLLATTWSLCAGAPVGDATTTEDDGLYRAPPPGEDGGYLPEQDQQGADDDGAYVPEKYETDESAGEGAYDAKKYEAVEGFDDGMYHPQPDAGEHDDGSYHPEVAERAVGDDGSYRKGSDENAGREDGSYRPEEYEKAEGDDGLYSPQLYESDDGDDGAYHQDTAEKVVGDDGSYRPDKSLNGEDHEGDYNPEIYEKVVGDDGSYRGSEEEDGSYHSNEGDLHQEGDGMRRPVIRERSVGEGGGEKTPETTLNAPAQPAEVGRGTAATRVRRQESGEGLEYGKAYYDGHSSKWDSDTLEEGRQQSDDGEYQPERHETPAPGAAHDWDRYWTEGAATAPTTEAADDGSYRPEHHTAEDYDERADSGQGSATPPVEPTEAADDGSYRPHQHTEPPPEDYDERADNGTDWRDNAVEQHDEGTEAADDGSYRPLEHGPRDRRAASEDTEEVQLSPVVFHVAPKPASGSVSDDDGDDARAIPPRPAEPPASAAAV